MKRLYHFILALALTTFGAMIDNGSVALAQDEGHWVGTWATAPMLSGNNNNPPSPGLANNSLRQIVQVSIGGELVRLKLSNLHGTDIVEINSVELAVAKTAGSSSEVEEATTVNLTFNGNTCTVSTDDENVTVTGTGEFIAKGTDRAEYKDYRWGSMNGEPVSRDILRLAYNVSFNDRDIQVATTDTMVVQTRESNKKEFFSPKYVKK